MRIAIAASPSAAIPSLEAIFQSHHELVRVISQPDRAAGRGRALLATPVSDWALSHGVELLRPEGADGFAAFIVDIDCVITIGYGVLLPENLLHIPKYGFLNIHFSILPHWRGAAPVQRSIEAMDDFSGITIFKLDKGMDTGPYYLMSRFALDLDITSDELLIELAEIAPITLLQTLDLIESGVKPSPQSEVGASRAFKLTKDQGRVNWRDSAVRVSAHIRAFTSNPGAWTIFRGVSIKVTFQSISSIQLAPGELRNHEGMLVIGTATDAIVIKSITPSGKSEIAASAWLNGARLIAGDSCE